MGPARRGESAESVLEEGGEGEAAGSHLFSPSGTASKEDQDHGRDSARAKEEAKRAEYPASVCGGQRDKGWIIELMLCVYDMSPVILRTLRFRQWVFCCLVAVLLMAPWESERRGGHVSDRFQRRRKAPCLEALHIFGDQSSTKENARLFHPPITFLIRSPWQVISIIKG